MFLKQIIELDQLCAKYKNQKGASLVEYGLLVALIAVACILALTNLGSTIAAKFTAIINAIGV